MILTSLFSVVLLLQAANGPHLLQRTPVAGLLQQGEAERAADESHRLLERLRNVLKLHRPTLLLLRSLLLLLLRLLLLLLLLLVAHRFQLISS